jgi:hypothetical protein
MRNFLWVTGILILVTLTGLGVPYVKYLTYAYSVMITFIAIVVFFTGAQLLRMVKALNKSSKVAGHCEFVNSCSATIQAQATNLKIWSSYAAHLYCTVLLAYGGFVWCAAAFLFSLASREFYRDCILRIYDILNDPKNS